MQAGANVVLIKRPVEWRPIPGWEGKYSVTRDGRVWSHPGASARYTMTDAKVAEIRRHYTDGSDIAVLARAFGVSTDTIRKVIKRPAYGVRKGRWLRYGTAAGYPLVNLYDGVGKKCFVHHLVMAAWGPPKPSPLHEVNHIDLNRANPDIRNLEWTTHSQNIRHAIANGHTVNRQFLTDTQVTEIRRRYARGGVTQAALAHKFGVGAPYISQIVTGRKRLLPPQ